MKVINLCDTSIILDDINVVVPYSRNREPQEIEERLVRRSRTLASAIKQQLLMDVTRGVPESLPPVKPFSISAKQRESFLVTDDHFKHQDGQEQHAIPRKGPGPSAPAEYKADGAMSVAWTGPACDAGGYARMNRRFMFGLRDRGVAVKYDMMESIADMDTGTMAELRSLQSTRIPDDAPKVYGQTAPMIWDWARYKMLFTMMETRRLHKDYVTRCNCADEIVVPSYWCKQVFEESGVKKPLHVVPLAVDTDIYRPDVEPIGFSKGLKPYVFLSVFGWSLRKGYDVLLKAYLSEFTSDDPVSLLIASRYFGSTDESKKQVIRDEIARISGMVNNPKKPHLVLFGDVLSDAMMPRLFAAADCYVLISRGEGFNLPVCEAAACRLPVITSRYSGHTDFCDDENSYLVDVDGFQSAEKKLAWISYFYEDAEFPIFGLPAVEQTRHFMRRAFENRQEAEAKAALLHDKIVKEYNWPVAVDKMYEKLKLTMGMLSGK